MKLCMQITIHKKHKHYIYVHKIKGLKSTGKFCPESVPNIIIHDPIE